jgi:predicted lactoylglutathione lyase
MVTDFPQAVPEIPVSNVDAAAEHYVNVLGFTHDWGHDEGGIAGISQGHCRMFLTNARFRAAQRTKSPVVVWLNLDSKQDVDELFARWKDAGGGLSKPSRTSPGDCASSGSPIRTAISCACSTTSVATEGPPIR